MSSENGSFDAFLLFWNGHVKEECPLSVCADAVWQELKWHSESTQLKQRFGLYSWLAWWVSSAWNSVWAPSRISEDRDFTSPGPVFALLDTPAHAHTLRPVLNESRVPSSNIIGSGCEIVPNAGFNIPNHSPNFYNSVKTLFLALRGASLTSKFLQQSGLQTNYHLKGRLADRIFQCLNALAWCETLTPAVGPLFLTYELLPWQKGLVWRWRKFGMRVIHMMHGQRLDLYQFTNATDLVLFSKIDEAWFQARVDPSVKLWAIGHPRLEDVRRQVGPARDTNTGLPRITFFSQPAEGDYSRSQRIADWQICSALRGKAEVRFRAHPREDRAMLAADMKAAGIDFMQVSDAGLIEDLKWCDAVASSWSTVSMEAAACGRGIFWTCSTPGKYEASQQLRDHGIGVLIQNSPDWAPYFRQWSEGGWKSPVTVSDEQLRELGMIGDTSKSWMERLEIEVATLSPKIEG